MKDVWTKLEEAEREIEALKAGWPDTLVDGALLEEAKRERDEALEQGRRLGMAHVNGVLDLREGESLVDCAIRLGRERDEARANLTVNEVAVDTARAERDEARALLREVEWNGERRVRAQTCPLCGFAYHEGHAPDCRLAAVLKA